MEAYCRRCKDWYRSEADIELLGEVGFCTLCYSEIREGSPIILEESAIGALYNTPKEPEKESLATGTRGIIKKDMSMDIVEFVSAETRIPVGDILAKNRRYEVVKAREACVFIGRTTGYSFPAIGRCLFKDHTTILHSFNMVKKKIASGDTEAMILLSLYKSRHS